MDLPTVSVLMPVFNGERFLREAIDSILAQSMPDFEFIIVDDGSEDDSWRIIQSYHDDRIRAFHRPHEGLVSSLNFGVSVAQSDWIARMDADDVSSPDRFRMQLEAISGHPEIAVLGGQCFVMNESGYQLSSTRAPENHEHLIRNTLYGGHSLCHPSVILNKVALEKVGGYRSRFLCAEDVDLWLRICEVGVLRCLPYPVLKLRKHDSNVSLDDRGRTQTIYALAARACYLRRKAGLSDPSELNETRWRGFVREIETVCDLLGVFRARIAGQRIFTVLSSVGRSGHFAFVRRAMRLAILLIWEPSLIHGLSRRPWLRALRHLAGSKGAAGASRRLFRLRY